MGGMLQALMGDFWSRLFRQWRTLMILFVLNLAWGEALYGFYFACFFLVFTIGSLFSDNPKMRLPTWQYSLPVSTSRLVGMQMLVGMSAITIIYGLSVLIIYPLCYVAAPPAALETLLFLLAFFACSSAYFWSASNESLGFLLLVSIGLALGWWIHPHTSFHPFSTQAISSSTAPISFLSVSWVRVLVLLGIIAAACFAAVVGVARHRCGEARPVFQIPRPGLWRKESSPPPCSHFASPASAQYWLERHNKGKAFPGTLIVLEIIVIAYCIYFKKSMSESLMLIIWMTQAGVIACAYIIGGSVGPTNQTGNPVELDMFRATRPASDQALAMAMLKNGMRGILASWLVSITIALLAMVLLLLGGHGATVEQAWRSWLARTETPALGVWAFPFQSCVTLLLAWLLLGLSTYVHMAQKYNILWFILFIALFDCINEKKLGYSPFKLWLLAPQGLRVFLGIAALTVVALALVAAFRRSLIGIPQSLLYCGLWLPLALAGQWYLRILDPDTDWFSGMIECGVLALAPVVPVLGALAIHHIRHR